LNVTTKIKATGVEYIRFFNILDITNVRLINLSCVFFL
jgi:hypothetical protein